MKAEHATVTPLKSGEIIEVEVIKIVTGGFGLAHAQGRTIMVALAAPGDRLQVEIERSQGNVSWARILEVIDPSSERIEPACPYFGRCGGCDFQQLGYASQLRAKAEVVRDCLQRIAKIEGVGQLEITGSPSEWNYRSRAMWQFDRSQQTLGYYMRNTNVVCDVAYCPILESSLQNSFHRLRSAMDKGGLPPGVKHFQAVAGDAGISVSPPFSESHETETKKTINGHTYGFSADGFFQINHQLLPELMSFAIEPLVGKWALDLYCGVGLFTLQLAERFQSVIGIENNRAAVKHARRNAEAAGFDNCEFHCAPVAEWMRSNSAKRGTFDAILLDPPRVGTEKQTLRNIIELSPSRISYISCDPATLARDLRPLLAANYEIDAIKVFDMFPQTHHIETVVHLRGDAPAPKRSRLK